MSSKNVWPLEYLGCSAIIKGLAKVKSCCGGRSLICQLTWKAEDIDRWKLKAWHNDDGLGSGCLATKDGMVSRSSIFTPRKFGCLLMKEMLEGVELEIQGQEALNGHGPCNMQTAIIPFRRSGSVLRRWVWLGAHWYRCRHCGRLLLTRSSRVREIGLNAACSRIMVRCRLPPPKRECIAWDMMSHWGFSLRNWTQIVETFWPGGRALPHGQRR